jgi:hypothetical protein
MFKCNKCNKKFKYESKLKEHKNRKIPCNKKKEEIKCEVCDMIFDRPNHKIKHEQTIKHKYNIQNLTINGNNNHVGDKINNIINLTLNVKSFKNTDFTYLYKSLIKDAGDEEYIKIINKKYICIQEKIKELFNSAIKILEQLHFNLHMSDNHNCKILLVFPGINKKVYEYLILEIDTDTNDMKWKSLKYEEFLVEIINHFTKMNDIVQNKNFTDYINCLNTYLLHDEEIKIELKPYIEEQLGKLYINFNNEQKKPEREIKPMINDKIDEYHKYRNDECTLNNGFLPDIINSEF